jgi:hypothetical protein
MKFLFLFLKIISFIFILSINIKLRKILNHLVKNLMVLWELKTIVNQKKKERSSVPKPRNYAQIGPILRLVESTDSISNRLVNDLMILWDLKTVLKP